jgi:hypothetical protein
MKAGLAWAILAAALVAAPARAQSVAQPAAKPAASSDPIGDLLAKQAQFDEPDEAAEPPPPQVRRSVRGGVTRELSDAAYDARIRASMAAAGTFRGPLEGGWTIVGSNGDLYDLQLSDKKGVVEGAWRDLRKAGAPNASGFIDAVERAGGEVTVRFGEGRLVALLRAQPDGRWTGELSGDGGSPRPVVLKRRGP